VSPRPIAFAPSFAAPRRPLLWNGEGIGAATPVATPDGPVAAERLRRGGRVLGAAGQVLTLREVHHLTLPAAVFRRLGLAPPVLVATGALGFGMPTAPLVLGPAQRIRLAGDWVEADRLVDGVRIVRLAGGAQMVQLGHGDADPLLAAGTMLAPAGAPPGGVGDISAQVEILLRLADASGVPSGRLAGFVDHADRFGVVGWALDTAAPERVVPLEVLVAGQVVACGLADQPRPDLARALAQAGRGTALARHGFALRFAAPLPAARTWMVELRRAGGGQSLPGQSLPGQSLPGQSLPGTPLLLDAATTSPARFDIALAGLADGEAAAVFLAGLVAGAAWARRR